MSKKSFKDNPAMAFITQPEEYTQAKPQGSAQEVRSKRIVLALTPSLHSNLTRIAKVEGISLTELINVVLGEHEQQNQGALEKYAEIWGDK